jgi:hypothetical protein
MATKLALMAMREAGEDEGNGKDGKSNGDGAKRAIARKRAMASNDDNKMMATETTTQHCCYHHHCPCLSHHSSSLCFGALVAASNNWWQRMRTKVGAWGGGGVLCGVLVNSETMFLHLAPVIGVKYFTPIVTNVFMLLLFGRRACGHSLRLPSPARINVSICLPVRHGPTAFST